MFESRSSSNMREMSQSSRDGTIDGFRAIAALGVVFAHAVTFRFADSALPGFKYLQKLAGSLAPTCVQIFFAVSGYIITTLLLTEQRKRGRISIVAFYIRRACRIVPPLVPLFTVIIICRGLGWIALDNASLLSSISFTCNLNFVDCFWWVAHTWSLAVEEQYYLIWPMLLIIMGPRPMWLASAIAGLLTGFVLLPLGWHNNYVSFASIAIGALYASSPVTRHGVSKIATLPLWLLSAALLIFGPPYLPWKVSQVLAPFLVLYLIFAARELRLPKSVLAWPPIQWVALGSYSLYLWQQLFFAKPVYYLGPVFPVWLLPIAVALSVYLVEQPFLRLGRSLSSAAVRRQDGPIEHVSDDCGPTIPAP